MTVGLEPVAVAVRGSEVWVVNHLSDSVSVVALEGGADKPSVVRTLLVGDEPRDIVFAGPNKSRAFITTAHRGQNNPNDPQLFTPGVGRADVWVFDATNLGDSLGGTPLTILTLFTDTPRALAVTPDGSTVYAAGFHTGNRTTTVNEATAIVSPLIGGPAAPHFPLDASTCAADRATWPGRMVNFACQPQPKTGVIVQYRQDPSDSQMHWLDVNGTRWDTHVRFNLPDKDVFAIDATATPPQAVSGGVYAGVGTVLYNMAVNPVSGKVYVSNTNARNDQRFEGPGTFAGTTLRGRTVENRITVLSASGGVVPRHLNKHIDYASCCDPVPNENAKSLALPMEMAVSSDGTKLYVAAFGSSKVAIYDTAALENDTFVPATADQVVVSGGGPSGVVLDEGRGRLYVMTRFDNSISTVDVSSRTEIAHVALYNPEPPSIVAGRRFLYDASITSSHGDSACASCHVFGDLDSLAWDLGAPDSEGAANPNPAAPPLGVLFPPGVGSFQSLKGPMTTQSLRGMANHGPMQWRGGRTGGGDVLFSAQPDTGAFDENAAFKKFSTAFLDLLGRDQPLTSAQMQAFADFMLQVTYPPNPIRNLDNSLTANQQAGRDHFFASQTAGIRACNECHVLDPAANAEFGVRFPGFFGSDGRSSIEGLDIVFPPAVPAPDFRFAATFKAPHLRNLYQKVGMFGLPFTGGRFVSPVSPASQHMGDQVRGFGFTHDGGLDMLDTFVTGGEFTTPAAANGFPQGAAGNAQRRQMAQFLVAFDSNMAPIVGQQITLTSTNAAVVGPRIDLLESRAAAGACDLVAKGGKAGSERGYLFTGTAYRTDRANTKPISSTDLRASAADHKSSVTFTCTPPGSGVRIGIDRDSNGVLDGDERK